MTMKTLLVLTVLVVLLFIGTKGDIMNEAEKIMESSTPKDSKIYSDDDESRFYNGLFANKNEKPLEKITSLAKLDSLFEKFFNSSNSKIFQAVNKIMKELEPLVKKCLRITI